MFLYDDIGDASSSLRGLTSRYEYKNILQKLRYIFELIMCFSESLVKA